MNQPSPQQASPANPAKENVTLTAELSGALDAWIGAQPEPRPSRAEAIGRLLAEALGVGDAGSIPADELNASNDELRTQLMPINRKWNLEKLIAAARDFPLRNREKLTFEYVLLDEVNDSAQNAREVVELIRGLSAKVNLIAWNPGPGTPYTMPPPEAVEAFRAALAAEGIPAYVRRPRGRDIYAACGQLKRTV